MINTQELGTALWTPPTKPDFKGVYYHKKYGNYIRVIGNTLGHIEIKWGEFNVVRSIDFLSDFVKLERQDNEPIH